MKVRALSLAVAAAALLSASPLCAQVRQGTVEIEPFAGYLFGGRFSRGSTDLFPYSVDVADEPTYGGRVGFNVTSLFEVEFQYSQTETEFEAPNSDGIFGPGATRLGDLKIQYFLGYTTFNFGHGRFVPYVTVGAGAADADAGGRGREHLRPTRASPRALVADSRPSSRRTSACASTGAPTRRSLGDRQHSCVRLLRLQRHELADQRHGHRRDPHRLLTGAGGESEPASTRIRLAPSGRTSNATLRVAGRTARRERLGHSTITGAPATDSGRASTSSSRAVSSSR